MRCPVVGELISSQVAQFCTTLYPSKYTGQSLKPQRVTPTRGSYKVPVLISSVSRQRGWCQGAGLECLNILESCLILSQVMSH